jgi:uncharacterized protein
MTGGGRALRRTRRGSVRKPRPRFSSRLASVVGFGLSRTHGEHEMNAVMAEHRTELEALCRRYGVRRLELFGSAATGREKPGRSDLDFLVEFRPAPPGGFADAFFGLQESLEALYGKPVDLVVASAIRNPFFRQAVEQTRTLLYAA